jgi:hypothetical protein
MSKKKYILLTWRLISRHLEGTMIQTASTVLELLNKKFALVLSSSIISFEKFANVVLVIEEAFYKNDLNE